MDIKINEADYLAGVNVADYQQLLTMYQAVQKERDELKAQVERLRSAIKNTIGKWEGVTELEPTLYTLMRFYNKTSEQCLAEIKAQVVEQVFNHFKNKFNSSEKLTVRNICWMLDEHLNQLRQQAEVGE